MTKRNHHSDDDMQPVEMKKLRVMGLLYVSVQSIYVQAFGEIVVSIGREYPDLGKSFGSGDVLLTEDDVYGEWVNGFTAQGHVRDFPSPKKKLPFCKFRELDHIASVVRTSWIYGHMFLAEKNGGNFNECVKLVERAAVTMRRVSDNITKYALALVEVLAPHHHHMFLKPAEEEELLLVHQEEHDLQVFVPRLGFEISNLFCELSRENGDVVPIEEKNEERVAFEVAVCDVFSFGVRTNIDESYDGVMLCATGLRKSYIDMTPEERVSSGSVLLNDILLHMDNERYEQAVKSALVAARALACNAAKLEAAVEMIMIRKK